MPKQLKKIFQFDFDSKDDYVAFFCDPKRVTRLEWRKSRQQNFRGWTSHSWLEAYLLDGSHTRYDFYADRGPIELLNAELDPMSQVYLGRGAEAHEFGHPLTLQVLRETVATVGARPYSMLEFNCHHFVLEVWNSSVIEALRSTHYPDRLKTRFVWRIGPLSNWLDRMCASWSSTSVVGVRIRSVNDEEENIRGKGSWLGRINASLSSTSSIDEKEAEVDLLRLCGMFRDESGRYFVNLNKNDRDSYWEKDNCSMPCLGECPEARDREIDGMFTATGDSRSNEHFKECVEKEHNGGKEDESIPSPPISMTIEDGGECPYAQAEFASTLESGKFLLLEKEGELTTMCLPLQGSGVEAADAVEKWATFCLPSVDVRIASRISKRNGAKDIVDSLARVPKSKSGINSSFSPVSMMSSSSDVLSHSIATIVDTCSTILQSSELRLVKPDSHKNYRPWRLRMPSGNARCEMGNCFQSTLQDIPDTVELTSVQHFRGLDPRHTARHWYTLQDIVQEDAIHMAAEDGSKRPKVASSSVNLDELIEQRAKEDAIHMAAEDGSKRPKVASSNVDLDEVIEQRAKEGAIHMAAEDGSKRPDVASSSVDLDEVIEQRAKEELPGVKTAQLFTNDWESFFRKPDSYRYPRKCKIVSL